MREWRKPISRYRIQHVRGYERLAIGTFKSENGPPCLIQSPIALRARMWNAEHHRAMFLEVVFFDYHPLRKEDHLKTPPPSGTSQPPSPPVFALSACPSLANPAARRNKETTCRTLPESLHGSSSP